MHNAGEGRRIELAAEAASKRIREELRFLVAITDHPAVRRTQREIEVCLSWLAHDLGGLDEAGGAA